MCAVQYTNTKETKKRNIADLTERLCGLVKAAHLDKAVAIENGDSVRIKGGIGLVELLDEIESLASEMEDAAAEQMAERDSLLVKIARLKEQANMAKEVKITYDFYDNSSRPSVGTEFGSLSSSSGVSPWNTYSISGW